MLSGRAKPPTPRLAPVPQTLGVAWQVKRNLLTIKFDAEFVSLLKSEPDRATLSISLCVVLLIPFRRTARAASEVDSLVAATERRSHDSVATPRPPDSSTTTRARRARSTPLRDWAALPVFCCQLSLEHFCSFAGTIMRAGGAIARRLLAVHLMLTITLASLRDFNDSFDVTSFEELNRAVLTRTSPVIITSERIVFSSRLEINASMMSIESVRTPAMLDGGGANRLFILNSSKLSLRCLQLAFGACEGCYGGAILVGDGSELDLTSVTLFSNRATGGGAIFAVHSTITATDCTMTSNSASSGGAIGAADNSTIMATGCTLVSNIASSIGAAVAVDGRSITRFESCTMTSNTAVWGGAIHARGGSTISATDSSMALNAARSGGAIRADNSIIMATGCTLASNAAIWSGAVAAVDRHSAARFESCMMTSNTAPWGGAIHAGDGSTITAMNCTITSNAAYRGGAIRTRDDSIVMATGCTLASNYGSRGGAISAGMDSTVTATDCTMASNSASDGGGAVEATGDSTVTATNCTMTMNHALSGGAMMLFHHHRTHGVILPNILLFRWRNLHARALDRRRARLHGFVQPCCRRGSLFSPSRPAPLASCRPG